MKKYLKNKNFIPISFIEKYEETAYEKSNKLIMLLLILNIFIMPNSISKISNIINQNEAVPVIEVNENKKDINKENIEIALNSISNNIENMKIQNNNGYIELRSIENIYDIEDEGKFKIKSVVFNENTVEVNIELWKRNT